jgi:hypothetical protein
LSRFSSYTEEALKADLKFKAVMLMADVYLQEMNVQLISDLVLSKDGTLTGPRRKSKDEE